MTCKDCIHFNVCCIMEISTDEEKENYLQDFGCSDFLMQNKGEKEEANKNEN